MWRAAAAFSGAIFVIAFVFAIGAGGPPASIEPIDTADKIAQALSDNRTNLVTGNYILLLASLALVVFSGYLRHVEVPEEGDEWPLTVALGGGLTTAAVLVGVALIGIAQGQLESYGSDAVIARTLLTLGWNAMWMIAPGLTALIGGITLITFNYETLPKTIGFIGTIVAILLVTPWWGIGIVGALIWVSAISITLGIRELRTSND